MIHHLKPERWRRNSVRKNMFLDIDFLKKKKRYKKDYLDLDYVKFYIYRQE